ncbi:transposable element Tcb2 transposase [Trichonephila clavipes]|nr:transposable element Tcb2 transposase [Trichonephila clavipes]
MPLRRFRRQYEQLSQFERGRIIGMLEACWAVRRVAHQLGLSDCVVRRCWDQWIREMSVTRRPGSGHPRQVSRSTFTRVPSVFSNLTKTPGLRTFGIAACIMCPALDAQPLIPPFGVVPRTRNWTAAEWNQVVFSDESRFNINSDDDRVHVRRPHGECLKHVFAS